MEHQPFVSILTPVYNGAEFLADCIECVLKQTHQNFEYIIVNNASTDGTLEIALEYAKKDQRIRVHDNEKFVGVIANHNIAFNLMSPKAEYCKVVSADDLIYPTCVEKMVELGQTHPDVSIIGCFQLSGERILWQGHCHPKRVFSGRELCRRIFLRGETTFGFGSPSSLIYRADIVRSSPEFYPNPSPHSDTSACFQHLRNSNYGFLYEILSLERTHEATQTSTSKKMERYLSAYLNDVVQYGPFYLDAAEQKVVLMNVLKRYRKFLSAVYFTGTGSKEFWDYHRSRLAELGYPINRFLLFRSAMGSVMQEAINPGQLLGKVWKRLSTKFNHRPAPGKHLGASV
jgi:glycosyltransferase involved in cell wall biosynthesis